MKLAALVLTLVFSQFSFAVEAPAKIDCWKVYLRRALSVTALEPGPLEGLTASLLIGIKPELKHKKTEIRDPELPEERLEVFGDGITEVKFFYVPQKQSGGSRFNQSRFTGIVELTIQEQTYHLEVSPPQQKPGFNSKTSYFSRPIRLQDGRYVQFVFEEQYISDKSQSEPTHTMVIRAEEALADHKNQIGFK